MAIEKGANSITQMPLEENKNSVMRMPPENGGRRHECLRTDRNPASVAAWGSKHSHHASPLSTCPPKASEILEIRWHFSLKFKYSPKVCIYCLWALQEYLDPSALIHTISQLTPNPRFLRDSLACRVVIRISEGASFAFPYLLDLSFSKQPQVETRNPVLILPTILPTKF